MEKQLLELYNIIIGIIGSLKAGIIGHLTLELYRGYTTKHFSLRRYLVSFIITLGLLYFAHTLLNYLGVTKVETRDLIMGFVGAFSLKIVEKLELIVPEILESLRLMFKSWVLEKAEKISKPKGGSTPPNL